MEILEILLHLDQHLNAWAGTLGLWSYVLLFLVVFCETGLIVTPFLPGDSLLFAVGALAAVEGSPLSLTALLLLLTTAAILGDAANYSIGRRAGKRILALRGGKLINQQHLGKTEAFYRRHGGKTIIMARFIPIIRTFAPFVAGIGKMERLRFTIFNVSGALLWVFSLVLAGYLFGNVPVVKENFHILALAIVGISILPIVVEAIRAWASTRAENAS